MSQKQVEMKELVDNWEDMMEAFYRLNMMYYAFPFLMSGGNASHDL